MKTVAEYFVTGLVAGGSYAIADELTDTSLPFWTVFMGIMFIGFIAVKRLGLTK